MAQLDDLYAALKNADAAGDTAGAQKLAAYIQSMPKEPAPAAPVAAAPASSVLDKIGAFAKQQVSPEALKNFVGKDTVLGAVRGATSIGTTLQHALNPLEWGNKAADEERRAGVDAGLNSLGADPNSIQFKNAKMAAEIGGTAGVGGLIAKPLVAAAPALEAVVPAIAPYVGRAANALGSSGFTTGAPAATNALAKTGDMALRMAGGATTGATSTGLINPNDTGTGAVVGAALPPALKAAGAIAEPVGAAIGSAAQATARRLMQSALKPTIAQLRSGEAGTAVQTLLDYGINPTEKGVQKLKDLVSGLNDQIATKIGGSDATVSKQNVLNALQSTKAKFGNQVSPTADLGAIDNVAADFSRHPLAPGETIPVQAAQQMKQGTYAVLKGKYGQMGSAETEAQKGLARGLKEEIATAVPGVGELNAEESRLLSTLSVAERRALMDANKNPVGLAMLAHNPLSWAAFMADKSAAFKALAARSINAMAPTATATNALATPLLYRSAPRSIQNGTQQ